MNNRKYKRKKPNFQLPVTSDPRFVPMTQNDLDRGLSQEQIDALLADVDIKAFFSAWRELLQPQSSKNGRVA